MNQLSSKSRTNKWAAALKRAAVTAIAATGLMAGRAYAGDLSIGIGINIHEPPPGIPRATATRAPIGQRSRVQSDLWGEDSRDTSERRRDRVNHL